MFNVLLPLKSSLKFSQVNIDNWCFKLHYKFTALILLGCSLIITTKELFGSSINCFISLKEVPKDVLQSYCWSYATFTLPSSKPQHVGSEVVYPGVDISTPDDESNIRYHNYYQWASFFYVFLAILYYTPHFIWKTAENQYLSKLVTGLEFPIIENDNKSSKIQTVTDYIDTRLGKHRWRCIVYITCEIMNFVNTVLQVVLINAFLGGGFFTYGADLISMSQLPQDQRVDPMITLFPRVTKCTFRKYGVGGDVQNHSAMCVLPLNMLNEKMFLFIWFWLLILSILSGLILVYRVSAFFSAKIRYTIMVLENYYSDHDALYRLVAKTRFSDWLFFSYLFENVHSAHCNDLVRVLDQKLNGQGDRNRELIPLTQNMNKQP